MAGAIPAVRSRFRGLGRWRRCRGRFPRKESRFGGRRRDIEVRGDDGAGARAPEEKRKKREMTSGAHDLPDKYLGITSSGPSAGPVRTVRESVVTVSPRRSTPRALVSPTQRPWPGPCNPPPSHAGAELQAREPPLTPLSRRPPGRRAPPPSRPPCAASPPAPREFSPLSLPLLLPRVPLS